MMSNLRDAALAADVAGDLIGAGVRAQRLVLQASRNGDVRGQVDALLLLARVSRHRRDAASLRRARDAAGVAVQLAEAPQLRDDNALRYASELELAASLAASGRLDDGFAGAARRRAAEDAAHAGWAWTTMGQARLAQGRTREATSALSNAVAEFERAPGRRRVLIARVLLATALTRAGAIEHGARLLDADLDHWDASGARRLRIEHHLALAENLRERGRTAQARSLLAVTADLLGRCTGMEATVVRLHQSQAACDLDWHQIWDARRHGDKAERIRASLLDEAGVRSAASAVPRPAAVRALGSRTPARADGLYRDLADAARELADTIVSEAPDGLPQGSALSSAAASAVSAEVRGLIARAKRSRSLDDGGATVLLTRLESLGAVPGAERLEATLLVRAGKLLRSLEHPRPLDAERLLRRALVRLARLPGMGLWQARANVGLAMTLRDAGRHDDALPYALRGVEVLDAERFEMDARATRKNWGKRQNDAFDCAIDLAHRCGRTDVAADLIVFSRAAGVVAESVGRLTPVPRLRYLDGTTSTLGGDGICLFA